MLTGHVLEDRPNSFILAHIELFGVLSCCSGFYSKSKDVE